VICEVDDRRSAFVRCLLRGGLCNVTVRNHFIERSRSSRHRRRHWLCGRFRNRATLENRACTTTDTFFHDVVCLLFLEVLLETLDGINVDGAHMVTDVGDANRLK
jgi:hypothetical protein